MNITLILAVLAILVFTGLALEELFRRTGIPDVLVLLLIGLAASATGLIQLDSVRGIDRVFTTVALVLILFEGAVRVRLSDLQTALGPALRVTLINFVASVVLVGLMAWALFGMRPLAAATLGAILGGTSSAVVIPMVQALRMSDRTRTALSLESALSDVLCIVFVLALVGGLTSQTMSVGAVGLQLVRGFVGALALGLVLGVAWSVGLRSLRRRGTSLVSTGAAVFLVYAMAESFGTSGAIACMAFGVVLGNASALGGGDDAARELDLTPGERLFLSEVAFLLKVFFFVYLGASLDLDGYQPFLFGGLVTVGVFGVRPWVVRLSFWAGQTTRRDASVASALVPKGLAAAVLADIPRQAGVAEGGTIQAVVFGTILLSIILASILVFTVDRPFVAHAYARIFGNYPEKLEIDSVKADPAPAAAAVAAAAGAGAVAEAEKDAEPPAAPPGPPVASA
jgi:NhaP-type Na+/H+ or K+/H+ antiporter